MPEPAGFILGEFRRTIDDRFRISIPTELAEPLGAQGKQCILTKERPGSLSLWSAAEWQQKIDASVQLIEAKMRAGRLDGRVEHVQQMGRLLSTRHTQIELQGRGRVLIPEAFRDFLGVDAGGELLIVGAAVCIEIWQPQAWIRYLEEHMPEFRQLFDDLAN
jgi:MraZ protein